MEYRGADFTFTPPLFSNEVKKPSIALWGTGKRIGKTAMGGYTARTARRAGMRPAVVTLSRGGPEEPHVLRGDRVALTPGELLAFQEQGMHAASDYVEDAVIGRCITVGCRRCGGGLAGAPFFSIVREGARLADAHEEVDLVILEGSGATLPEVKADHVVLLASAVQEISSVAAYFGPYRVLGADLIILGGCEPPFADEERVGEFRRALEGINPDAPVATVVFRPAPLADIRGKEVFYATTAPEAILPRLESHLTERYGCRIVGSSGSLAAAEDLEREIGERGRRAEVFLTELKASAVATVARLAAEMDREVVFCDNEPEVVPGGEVEDLAAAIGGLLGVGEGG
jgi:cyclic 2,3-diphosphoglycerate synthetase